MTKLSQSAEDWAPEAIDSPPRVYVAGPIHGSGTQASNMATALLAAEVLAENGCVPFVPHLWFPWEVLREMRGTNEQGLWQRIDFTWLRECHALVRLEGESPGVDAEVDFAHVHNIPVFAHHTTGAARGDPMTPVRMFLAELTSGRFDAHRREAADRDGELGYATPAPSLRALSGFQAEMREWLERQPFGPGQQAWEPLLGIVEELGELSHAHLKEAQNIRGTEVELQAKARDAVGDIFIYLTGYCIVRGWDVGACIERAWAEVSKRDWNKNRDNGVTEPARMTGRHVPWLKQDDDK